MDCYIADESEELLLTYFILLYRRLSTDEVVGYVKVLCKVQQEILEPIYSTINYILTLSKNSAWYNITYVGT